MCKIFKHKKMPNLHIEIGKIKEITPPLLFLKVRNEMQA